MNSKTYSYLLLLMYLLFFGYSLNELIQAGIENIRTHQVLLFLVAVFVVIEKLRSMSNEKNDE